MSGMPQLGFRPQRGLMSHIESIVPSPLLPLMATAIDQVCPKAEALGIKSMKQHLTLDAWRLPCSNA